MYSETKTPSNIEIEKQIFGIKESLINLKELLINLPPEYKILVEKTITRLNQELTALNFKIQDLEKSRNKFIYLPEIGAAINSSLNTSEVLRSVIDTIIKHTGAQKSILMLKNKNDELEFRLGRDNQKKSLLANEVDISTSVLQRVLQEGQPILTINAKEDPRFGKESSILHHNMRSILCVPLIVQDEILGVIYSENKANAGQFDTLDKSWLMGIATQAAVAIENSNLYGQLQQSNAELQIGYNSTLEGWARALELRDHETQGHTERVTVLTIELAKFMGVDNQALIQIKRGSLLHDIGKMGIPDGILNKPGPLNEEERQIIEMHPTYAMQMISDIDFLKPAMDIPYAHHEKWDGTGYPRKLKETDIPFSARIFAVVDVWDAMTTDRPYRGALPEEEVARYIQANSRSHFDPDVVKAFGKMRQISLASTDAHQAV